MVDEALIEYLKTKLGDLPNAEERLRHLFEYNQEDHQFSLDETKNIINAIDEVNVLDPACGSGAFPMGVLHKLVFILNKLDTGNKFWKEKQIAKAIEIPDPEVRNRVISEIDLAFEDNELDYGRKLFLIENCIYGVDIQPIAVQIAKLRFFISLVVDQKSDVKKSNLGIRPLPNLETKFVAANSIIHIERPQQMMLHNPLIEEKEKKLAAVRSSLFTARTPETKRKYRDIDYKLREKLAILLESDGWGSKSASQLSSWNPYDQNSSAEFLDPEWMFGIKEGFDIVIGNPPYITLRSLDEEIKNYIKQNYRYSRGGDIYVAFIERSINLLNKRGILSFIVPNKFFGADYGKAIRKYLQFGEPEIISIWDLKDEKVFENAMISTIVLIVRNQRIGTIPILKQDEDRFEFPNLFDSDGKIQIDSNEKSKLIIQKIKKYPVLQKFADIRTGIMGFDYWKMEPIVQDKQPNSDLIRLFTNGNFSRYTNKWGYKWVNLYKKKYLYPVIKLDPQFINQNTIKLFKTTPKIIVRGVSKRLAAILDDHGAGLLVVNYRVRLYQS
jgi:hypothetical protein